MLSLSISTSLSWTSQWRDEGDGCQALQTDLTFDTRRWQNTKLYTRDRCIIWLAVLANKAISFHTHALVRIDSLFSFHSHGLDSSRVTAAGVVEIKDNKSQTAYAEDETELSVKRQ